MHAKYAVNIIIRGIGGGSVGRAWVSSLGDMTKLSTILLVDNRQKIRRETTKISELLISTYLSSSIGTITYMLLSFYLTFIHNINVCKWLKI